MYTYEGHIYMCLIGPFVRYSPKQEHKIVVGLDQWRASCNLTCIGHSVYIHEYVCIYIQVCMYIYIYMYTALLQYTGLSANQVWYMLGSSLIEYNL